MTFRKPDGIIVIGFSGCCCPPGERKKGQHTNSCTSWWRIERTGNGSPWTRLHNFENARVLAEAANSAVEFSAAMIQDV